MRRILRGIPLAVLLAASPLPAAEPIDALGWIAGCWQAEGGPAGAGEWWMPPAGGMLLGMSRTPRPGRSAMFEFMRIEQAADGSIALLAQPLGRPETRFAAREHGADGAVFENPAHDFPQRVIYRRDGAARIAARIEGPAADGGVQGIDFPLQRVSCDGLVAPPG